MKTLKNKTPFVDIGTARITPVKPIMAGSYQTIKYVYTAGHPIDDTGYIKIVFRYAGDFGTPQFDQSKQPNYCSVSANGDCRIEPRWDPKGHTRPWGKSLYLKVMGGFLAKGDKVTVTFGDTSQGSPGWQIQTFCEQTFEFKTLVDPFATYQFKELPVSPTIRITPGKPTRLVCIAPSQVIQNKKFEYFLRFEDQWGNVIGKAKRKVHPGFKKKTPQYISVKDSKTGLSAVSNPIDVLSTKGKRSRWWADFHGQSEETIGSNSIDAYFSYAKDCAKIDIAAHQGNDFQVTDEFWKKVNQTTRKFYQPGKFVTFPGYEWSGNTPKGGDRNIYFKNEGGKITRSHHDLLPEQHSKYIMSPTAKELFKNLDGPDPFVFAHVGGRYPDLSMHRENVEIGMEVHSAWGTFEWLVENALSRGYRIGICANSDGHKGRPGSSYPGASRFGSLGGFTCVLAEKLDRDSVHTAMQKRHFYATTGNRPILDVSVVTSDGQQAIMGDVIEINKNDKPTLCIRVVGTDAIDNIIVRNGLDMIKTLRPYKKDDLGSRIKVVWSGAEVKGRDRLVIWDGSLKLSRNKIRKITPINFWNPIQPIIQASTKELHWKSITTGGLSGVIIELDHPMRGTLSIDTMQKKCWCDIKSIGLKPKTYKAGGLHKKIELCRLPDITRSTKEFQFTLPLSDLHNGDNPIYIRLTQEDGHMAWSSPIYIHRKK